MIITSSPKRNPDFFTNKIYINEERPGLKRCFFQRLLFFSCCRLCISSFGSFPISPVSHPIPDFYAKISALYADIPCYLGFYVRYRARCATGMGWGYLGWSGGILGLVRVFNQAWILTWQPDSWCRIPVQIPFPQGTGDLSSADHSWIGPCNVDFNLIVYPPPYLRKGFFPFLCHDSTQLREYNQGFHP